MLFKSSISFITSKKGSRISDGLQEDTNIIIICIVTYVRRYIYIHTYIHNYSSPLYCIFIHTYIFTCIIIIVVSLTHAQSLKAAGLRAEGIHFRQIMHVICNTSLAGLAPL